jgi:multidrug efflux system membrane fusion protein
VTRGEQTVDKIEIRTGLQAGEQVITEGADRLKDGAKVVLPGDRPSMGGPGGGRGGRGGRGGQAGPAGANAGVPAGVAGAGSPGAGGTGAANPSPDTAGAGAHRHWQNGGADQQGQPAGQGGQGGDRPHRRRDAQTPAQSQ